VLVVDDDCRIRDTLAELLAEEGYGVTTADSGSTAIAALRQHHCCMVLLDLMMPTTSGWKVLAELLEDPALAPTPVCVISALSTDAPLGTVGVLRKPLDLDRLLAVVHEHAGVP
jgi:CheY-like chemotaxis protein